jgi:flagellar basal-body rod protein FlgC
MPATALMAISASGLDLERLRVDVAALNLANANIPLARDGSGWRPLRVVPVGAGSAFAAHLGPPPAMIQQVTDGIRRVHEPGSPLADANGDVAYPAVDPLREMLNLQQATRAYEANLAVLQASRGMLLKTLEIGRSR